MEIIDINLIEKFESESENVYQERINFKKFIMIKKILKKRLDYLKYG